MTPNLAISCDRRVIEAWPALWNPEPTQHSTQRRPPLFLLIDPISIQDLSSSSRTYDY